MGWSRHGSVRLPGSRWPAWLSAGRGSCRPGALPGTVAMLVPFVTGGATTRSRRDPTRRCWDCRPSRSYAGRPRGGPRRRVALVASVSPSQPWSRFTTSARCWWSQSRPEIVAARARRPGVWMALGPASFHWSASFRCAGWRRMAVPSGHDPLPDNALHVSPVSLPSLLPAAIVLAVWSLLSCGAGTQVDGRRTVSIRARRTGHARRSSCCRCCAGDRHMLGAYHARYLIAMVLGFAGLAAGAMAGARSPALPWSRRSCWPCG